VTKPDQHNQKARKEVKTRLREAFKEYAPTMLRFLVFRLKNENDAQDLAQEAYLRLARVKEPDMIRQPDAYLFKIADNLANEFLMKKGKNLAEVDFETATTTGLDTDRNAFVKSIEVREAIRNLENILDDMPSLYKAILLMRKRDGLSHKEIAKKLDISPNTVHVYLTRALMQCRTQWAD